MTNTHTSIRRLVPILAVVMAITTLATHASAQGTWTTKASMHLASGSPAPAGYTFVGRFIEELLREGDERPFRMTIDLYVKNQGGSR